MLFPSIFYRMTSRRSHRLKDHTTRRRSHRLKNHTTRDWMALSPALTKTGRMYLIETNKNKNLLWLYSHVEKATKTKEPFWTCFLSVSNVDWPRQPQHLSQLKQSWFWKTPKVSSVHQQSRTAIPPTLVIYVHVWAVLEVLLVARQGREQDPGWF